MSMHISHHYERGARSEYTWAPRFELTPAASKEQIIRAIGSVATAEWPIAGAIPGMNDALRTTVLLGLHPSRTDGTPSLDTCAEIESALAGLPGWQLREEQDLPELRSIMGRRVGYDRRAHTFSFEDVLAAVEAEGAVGLTVVEADLFSFRHIVGQGIRHYNEPAAVFSGRAELLPDVLNIAHVLQQERAFIELMGVSTQVYDLP